MTFNELRTWARAAVPRDFYLFTKLSVMDSADGRVEVEYWVTATCGGTCASASGLTPEKCWQQFSERVLPVVNPPAVNIMPERDERALQEQAQ